MENITNFGIEINEHLFHIIERLLDKVLSN